LCVHRRVNMLTGGPGQFTTGLVPATTRLITGAAKPLSLPPSSSTSSAPAATRPAPA
jgi:hypothetical protein